MIRRCPRIYIEMLVIIPVCKQAGGINIQNFLYHAICKGKATRVASQSAALI
jgi:hypothetical protein